MNCSLIITTYNWPEALSIVLSSLTDQTIIPDEVIIADDGSTKTTKKVINFFLENSSLNIIHSWQKDKGFRLSKSRNRAIALAKSDYIIAIDGDMIMHKNFIEDHLKFARKHTYIQGSRVLLQPEFSAKILDRKYFINPSRLNNEAKNILNSFRLPILPSLIALYRNRSLNRIRGCNFSLFKEDILKVNGFNEDFEKWGQEDSEFVQRLFNFGLYRVNLKFSGIQYHLFHKVGSSNTDNIELLNKSINEQTIWCNNGIDKYL